MIAGAQGTCMVLSAKRERRLARAHRVPGGHRDDEEHGDHIEDQDPPDHGRTHARDGAAGLSRFRGGDGGDLRAGHREEYRRHGCEHRDPAVRREAPMSREIAERGAVR